MKGRIMWFNETKNYGFIKGEDGENYFVHKSQLNLNGLDYAKKDAEVDFIKVETDKGLQAHNVTFLWVALI